MQQISYQHIHANSQTNQNLEKVSFNFCDFLNVNFNKFFNTINLKQLKYLQFAQAYMDFVPNKDYSVWDNVDSMLHVLAVVSFCILFSNSDDCGT